MASKDKNFLFLTAVFAAYFSRCQSRVLCNGKSTCVRLQSYWDKINQDCNVMISTGLFRVVTNALVAEGNPSAGEVVRRKLHSNWIANQNPYEVFAYPSANGAQDDLARSPNLHAEHRARQTLLYHTFDLIKSKSKGKKGNAQIQPLISTNRLVVRAWFCYSYRLTETELHFHVINTLARVAGSSSYFRSIVKTRVGLVVP